VIFAASPVNPRRLDAAGHRVKRSALRIRARGEGERRVAPLRV
jgi:hypothetical protein